MKIVGNGVDVPGQGVDPGSDGFIIKIDARGTAVKLDRQECKALADVIVELSGDSTAFIFLGGNQPPAEPVQLTGHRPPSLRRPEKCGNQQALYQNDRDNHQNQDPVIFPHCRRPENDNAALRQRAHRNFPTRQLPPIECQNIEIDLLQVDGLGWFTLKNTGHQRCGPATDPLGVEEETANDP